MAVRSSTVERPSPRRSAKSDVRNRRQRDVTSLGHGEERLRESRQSSDGEANDKSGISGGR
jgi:hypothetical protein